MVTLKDMKGISGALEEEELLYAPNILSSTGVAGGLLPLPINPLDIQIGGDHYKTMKIQPVEFIMANNLNFCEGSAIKYICRHRAKHGRVDIEKAIHYLELLLKEEYGT